MYDIFQCLITPFLIFFLLTKVLNGRTLHFCPYLAFQDLDPNMCLEPCANNTNHKANSDPRL